MANFAGAASAIACAGPDRRQQQRQRHDHRQQRHRPPHDPPRARPERLQRERRDQPRRHDSKSGSGIKQAEQKIRALGTRLRDRCRQRGAADESGRRAEPRQQPRKTQDDKIARQRAQRQRRDAGQRSPAHACRQPDSLDDARGNQRAGEIADGIDRVHEARGGIRPAEAVAHVRQHQRIGEAADPEANRRRQRNNQDQPRGMRDGGGRVGGSQDMLRQAAMWQASVGLHRAAAAMVSCQSRNAALALRAAVISRNGYAVVQEPRACAASRRMATGAHAAILRGSPKTASTSG